MKKLTLNSFQAVATEVLTRSQLKNVLGGVEKKTTKPCYETDRCWECCRAKGESQQSCDSYCG